MAVRETGVIVEKLYQGATLVDTFTLPSGGTNFYKPDGYYNAKSATAPANPVFYAFDGPGVPKASTDAAMVSNSCDEIVYTIALTAYPPYDDPSGAHLDAATVKSHTFKYTCTSSNSNGTGTYTWSVAL